MDKRCVVWLLFRSAISEDLGFLGVTLCCTGLHHIKWDWIPVSYIPKYNIGLDSKRQDVWLQIKSSGVYGICTMQNCIGEMSPNVNTSFSPRYICCLPAISWMNYFDLVNAVLLLTTVASDFSLFYTHRAEKWIQMRVSFL